MTLLYNGIVVESHLSALSLVPVLGQAVVLGVSSYIIHCILNVTPNTDATTTPLSSYLLNDGNLSMSTLYMLTFAVMILTNPSAVVFLPWIKTDFTVKSNGFPCFWVVKTCMITSIVNASLALLAAIVLLTLGTQNSLNNLLIMLQTCGTLLYEAGTMSVLFFIEKTKVSSYDDIVISKFDPNSSHHIDVEAFSLSTIDYDGQSRNHLSCNPSPSTDDLELTEIDDRVQEEDQSTIRNSIVDILRLSEEIKLFRFSNEFLDLDLKIKDEQLKSVGIIPLRYIPLADIEKELGEMMSALNSGQPFDEARMDYLLACLNINPEFKQRQEQASAKFLADLAPDLARNLKIMRSFVPPSIFTCSKADLMRQYINQPSGEQEGEGEGKLGYSTLLAGRLMTKKVLWLIRMMPEDMQCIHEADLMSKYSFESQGLDFVELLAIYAVVPAKFSSDGSGKKAQWRTRLQTAVEDIYKRSQAGKLTSSQKRHPAYENQEGRFGYTDELYSPLLSTLVVEEVANPIMISAAVEGSLLISTGQRNEPADNAPSSMFELSDSITSEQFNEKKKSVERALQGSSKKNVVRPLSTDDTPSIGNEQFKQRTNSLASVFASKSQSNQTKK